MAISFSNAAAICLFRLDERAVRRIVRRGARIGGQQLPLTERAERMGDVQAAPNELISVLTDGRNASLLMLGHAR
jgi:hypothetical protein